MIYFFGNSHKSTLQPTTGTLFWKKYYKFIFLLMKLSTRKIRTTKKILLIHFFMIYIQKQSSRGILMKRCSENMQQVYWRTPIPKCDFNKDSLQLYCNHTLVWVFCKFAAYFQNTFLQEHFRRPASVHYSTMPLTHFSLVLHFILKPVNYFAM